MAADTRWIQRYANYHKACGLLIQLTEERDFDSLSKLETEGLVQRFEYTFELAWKVLQDILLFSGYEFAPGPKGSIKTAFEAGFITNHDGWCQMLRSRLKIKDLFDENDINSMARTIYFDYAPLLKALDTKLSSL
ncbi:MAG: HI0074 family nucleotidyltransferase substrate-binding subunit [Bacteroidales bacterium]|nr:HI0074 family nucleotidyltransferase substrate-binding subunit [Bacteroidales bacterium]